MGPKHAALLELEETLKEENPYEDFAAKRAEQSLRQSTVTNTLIEQIEAEESGKTVEKSNEDLQEFCYRHIAKIVAIELMANDIDLTTWHK